MAIPSLAADPCGRAAALREVRDQLMIGGGVAEAEHEAGNGNRRRVKYEAADRAALEREIAAAESACALQSGGRPSRFAIGGRP